MSTLEDQSWVPSVLCSLQMGGFVSYGNFGNDISSKVIFLKGLLSFILFMKWLIIIS